MKEEKFDMMMGILKILEKKNDPEITQSILEIVDSYDERLTPEQKAKVLDGFLRFRNGSKRGLDDAGHKKRMEEAAYREQMRRIFEPDLSL